MKKITLIALSALFGILATVTAFAALKPLGFSDVKPTDWFFRATTEAQQLGLMNGVDGKFLPSKTVNRAELAVILQKERQIFEREYIGTLQNWVTSGGLLEGHHLYVYDMLFRQFPFTENPGDDPRVMMKDIWTKKGFEKAFDVTEEYKSAPFTLSVYAEKNWQTKKISQFFINSEFENDGVKWFGPFIDDVKRLQGNLADLK